MYWAVSLADPATGEDMVTVIHPDPGATRAFQLPGLDLEPLFERIGEAERESQHASIVGSRTTLDALLSAGWELAIVMEPCDWVTQRVRAA